MKNEHFVSDMALESAQSVGFDGAVLSKELGLGIVKRTLTIKNIEQEKRVGRKIGTYTTYDFTKGLHTSKNATKYMSGLLSQSLWELVGTLKKSATILVVGLGNGKIVADSLGERVVSRINVSTQGHGNMRNRRICAISPGVLGTTGMQTADIICGVASKIKPNVVVLVDSLATGTLSRVGKSFQISNVGISPGSGVGQDKERIDKHILGVPTFSIGVPLLLSLRTGIYAFVKELLNEQNVSVSEFALREKLSDTNLTDLIVAPRNIDYLVSVCADVVARAINDAFSV